MTKPTKSIYYALDSFGQNQHGDDNRMLLYSLPGPARRESWTKGQRFKTPLQEPVVVIIQTGNERGCDLLPYWGTPPVMSNEFYKALCDAGVKNMDAYDAVLRSEDGKVEYKGFKAVNILGLISAADLKKTEFSDPEGSRLLDAHISKLAIDSDKAQGLLMFRLAEYTGAVIVHESVKRFIEPMKFPYAQFIEQKDFIS